MYNTYLQSDSEGPDQTAPRRSLIRAFAVILIFIQTLRSGTVYSIDGYAEYLFIQVTTWCVSFLQQMGIQ